MPPTIKDHHKTLAFNLDTVLRREPMLENLKYHKKGVKMHKKRPANPAQIRPKISRTGPDPDIQSGWTGHVRPPAHP